MAPGTAQGRTAAGRTEGQTATGGTAEGRMAAATAQGWTATGRQLRDRWLQGELRDRRPQRERSGTDSRSLIAQGPAREAVSSLVELKGGPEM